jgi:excisionase family DNA binding protein
MVTTRRLMRITEASEYLGISPTTLRVWVRAGLVPVMKSPTGRYFWTTDMLNTIRESMVTVLSDETK